MRRIMKITAAVILFSLSLHEQSVNWSGTDTVTVFLTEPLERDRAEEICTREAEGENGVTVCFWQEQPEAEILCRETGQNCRVRQLFTEGNTELLFPEAALLTWLQEGCYLDVKTAVELLGAEASGGSFDAEQSGKLLGAGAAKGQIIWGGENSFTVKGTVRSEERLMVCPAQTKGELMFSTLTLGFSDDGNLRGQAEQFLMRNGLSGKTVELTFLKSLLHNLLLLFPTILIIKQIFYLLKKSKKLCFLAAAGMAVLFLWLLAKNIWISEDMIPTRWSDFSFWESWWQGEKENLLQIIRSPMGAAHLNLLFRMGKTFVYGLGAIFLIV